MACELSIRCLLYWEVMVADAPRFLLARLHHDSLKGIMTKKALLSALKKFPTGSAAYNHAYKEAMMRIMGQLAHESRMANNILSWICCARRPLSPIELQHALAVELGEPKLDQDNIPRLTSMLSVCAGLVICNEEANTVGLVHYTTKEYFDSTWKDWFPDAHVNITVTCLTYLSFAEFERGIHRNHEDFKDDLIRHALYSYCAINWGHHAREVEQSGYSTTKLEAVYLKFLESENHITAALQALVYDLSTRKDKANSQLIPEGSIGLHMTAYFGLEEGTRVLLARGLAGDTQDTYGRTPLHLAAENGHESIVRLLLELGMDTKIKDFDGQTPLTKAAKNRHMAIMELLVGSMPDIDIRDKNGRTQLHWAAEAGNEHVVRMLLENGANASHPDCDGSTPLICAAAHGRDTVVELLLKYKAEVNSEMKYAETALTKAAEKGHHTVIVSLLEAGAKVNKKDWFGNAALHEAAAGRHLNVVSLLLEAGADIETTDINGLTPLSVAAMLHDDAKVVDLLIKAGADLRAKDKWGRPILSKAANGGSCEVVACLLETGFEVDCMTEDGETPLSHAVKQGHISMAQMLLEHGAQVDLPDRDGITPLAYAVRREDLPMAAVLLKHGADPSSKDKINALAIDVTGNDCYHEIFRLLLKNYARLDFPTPPPWKR